MCIRDRYQKARCFRDEKVAAEILKTDDVGRIKELGRDVYKRQWSFFAFVFQVRENLLHMEEPIRLM